MKLVIKDSLIEQVAEELGHPIDTIEKVIAFQGKEMLQAVKEYNEIEVSGFGTFYVSQNKVNKHISRVEGVIAKRGEQLLTANEEEKKMIEGKLRSASMVIETYKMKQREQTTRADKIDS